MNVIDYKLFYLAINQPDDLFYRRLIRWILSESIGM